MKILYYKFVMFLMTLGGDGFQDYISSKRLQLDERLSELRERLR